MPVVDDIDSVKLLTENQCMSITLSDGERILGGPRPPRSHLIFAPSQPDSIEQADEHAQNASGD